MNQPFSLPFSFTFFSLFLIMACSKLFSGDLPEITNYTIQYLRNDLKSLYSCIFVNRHLCQITIPILWEDPFSVKCQEGSHNLLDTCSLFFNEDDKTKLKEFGITINSPSFEKPLFNYPSFIKTFNTFRVELHTVNWINNLDLDIKSSCLTNQVKSAKMVFFPMFDFENKSLGIKKFNSREMIDFICSSLFKLFINNNVSLNDLIISFNYSHGNSFLKVFELILDHPKFISNVKNFTLNGYDCPKFNLLQPFLTSLPSLLPSIKHLDISIKNILPTIPPQVQLLSLSLFFTTAFNYYSNTLISIKFDYCDFTKILSFDGLKSLIRLRSLQFISCKGLTTQVFQPLLDLPTLKIRSLKVIGQISGIDLLLQKIGSCLKHLELDLSIKIEREKAFESLINHCDQIQFLYLLSIDYEEISHLYKLITHLDKNLKYLSLQNKNHFSDETSNLNISSMILKGLGQILPNSLEYLDLDLGIESNHLKNFLDNCEHVELNKLLVRNRSTKNLDVTFNILKTFVREKKVKNFAYQVNCYFDPDNLEHQNLEKLVSETQHFVKLKRYSDLTIRISDFDLI